MNVGIMRMTVAHPFVAMHVTVRLRQQLWILVMPVMFIMAVAMLMFDQLMHMLVFMPLSQV